MTTTALIQTADQTITASGHTDPFNTTHIRTLWAVAFIGGATGTTPSIAFHLEQQDANGNWIVVATIGIAITSGPNYTAGYAGEAAGGMFADTARLGWTVTGTNPSFTGVDLSVIGRE